MNRLDQLFSQKAENILSVYFTAGYPELDSTLPILKVIEESGADIAEIGFPFSDPLADGPVIQASSDLALKNGMNLDRLLTELIAVKNQLNIPLVLMGYLNPIMSMGTAVFIERCKAAGIDGVILPDVPLDEWERGLADQFKAAGIHPILLVSPRTDDDRLKRIDRISSGFLYAVTMSGITGGQISGNNSALERFKTVRLKNPVLAGFGIHDKASFDSVCKFTQGGIIGSAFIKSLQGKNYLERASNFLKNIR
jgi:tryptophan synthase alpha chain